MLNDQQQELFARAGLRLKFLDAAKIEALCQRRLDESTLSDDELLEFLELANALYRAGQPIISDGEYDFTFIAELRRRHPAHPFLLTVEPESIFLGKTVELPEAMLSTEKAYSVEQIERWLERIRKAAGEINLDADRLTFRATPKLDGFAAYDDGIHLYTRGDGKRGTDISRVLERGLTIAGNGQRGLGAGEIVVSKSYFRDYLADLFENARNFQASVVKEKELEPHVAQAILEQAAVFYPFSLLPAWQGQSAELQQQLEEIVARLLTAVDYDVDGVIFEVCHDELKNYMGATRHHHRWQIALKQNVETAAVRVVRVHPQTSRSGRVNPVAELEPTRLSGAMIQRATAHHYGMVKANGIGPGAVIELTRSGEVIPKIVRVIHGADPQIPEHCPSCGAELIWDGDYLLCPNSSLCPAQIAHSIEHFFRTLGNVDGFGPAAMDKLFAYGVRSVAELYHYRSADFERAGFGPKQAENLCAQLIRSRSEQIEDWRFLAAFGVFRMAGGNCERLLRHYQLEQIFTLSVEQLVAIEGFAEKTAAIVVDGFKKIQPIFSQLFALGFNLERTALLSEQQLAGELSPIAGKLLVFTGTMRHGSRQQMQAHAKKCGAKVGSSVSAKTDYLVTGEQVGASKIAAATAKGVAVITEQDYLTLINQEMDSTVDQAREQEMQDDH